MTPAAFVASRPCLEEIDGYLLGLQLQGLGITTQTLEVISAYKTRLMIGKETPAPTRLKRAWDYRQGRKPVPA